MRRCSTCSFHPARLAILYFAVFWTLLCFGQVSTRSVLCRDGNGTFDAEFRTGVRVHIGATRDPGVSLAGRTCAARLSWEKQDLTVSAGASQVDLDAFGIDLGDEVPVATFQVKKSDRDCCVEYRIYSLNKSPRLQRIISGGEFFTASDADLDGNVEIWTNDAAAVDGFERLTLGEFDSAPTVVLHFAHGALVDASAEFQTYFDQEIDRARQALHPQDLDEFKKSDGQLAEVSTPSSTERLHRLRGVKVKVLEIVWAYLYSGREQDAWHSLAEMWPAADVDRIRAAIVKTRERGIHGQVETTSAIADHKKKHARIYDAVNRQGAAPHLDVIPPQPILLEFPPPAQNQPPSSQEELLDLVIDAAGKVRSIEVDGNSRSIAPEKIAMAWTWKFIPAFKDGRAVASRTWVSVAPKQ